VRARGSRHKTGAEREIDRRVLGCTADQRQSPSSSPDERGGERENTLMAMIELAANTE
jgi:hypothetical protein